MSLALREGDPATLLYYFHQVRWTSATSPSVDRAYATWVIGRASGLNALVLLD